MIVVDTNIIVYLYLPTEYSGAAEKLLDKHSEWVAPLLWRSEFRNVLAGYLRKKLLTFDQAYAIQEEAEQLMQEREFEIPSLSILQLVNASDCSAYDCEFVALAQSLDTTLYTIDKKILNSFPDVAVSLAVFA